MGKVIVVTSGKGGVGKSTSTANLGTALALLNQRVVVVDADIGLRNLDVIMGLESRVVYTSMDVIEGTCDLDKALVKDRRTKDLHLLAASQKDNKDDIQPEQMKKICLELKEEYDYVLVDSPAGIEQGFRNAAAGADVAIILTTPEIPSVRDADRIIGLLMNMNVAEMGLIINRLAPKEVEAGNMMEPQDIIDILSIDLIGVIPEDKEIFHATGRGLPLTYNHHSSAGQAYRRIARRIDGEDIPIPEFKPGGWLGNLFKFNSFKRV